MWQIKIKKTETQKIVERMLNNKALNSLIILRRLLAIGMHFLCSFISFVGLLFCLFFHSVNSDGACWSHFFSFQITYNCLTYTIIKINPDMTRGMFFFVIGIHKMWCHSCRASPYPRCVWFRYTSCGRKKNNAILSPCFFIAFYFHSLELKVLIEKTAKWIYFAVFSIVYTFQSKQNFNKHRKKRCTSNYYLQRYMCNHLQNLCDIKINLK